MQVQMIVVGNDKELSAKVQNILFGAGFKWRGNGQEVRYPTGYALFADENGHITHTSNRDKSLFNQGSEYTFRAGNEITPELAATFAGAKKQIPVKELTMAELNKLSVEHFGHEIKIKK